MEKKEISYKDKKVTFTLLGAKPYNSIIDSFPVQVKIRHQFRYGNILILRCSFSPLKVFETKPYYCTKIGSIACRSLEIEGIKFIDNYDRYVSEIDPNIRCNCNIRELLDVVDIIVKVVDDKTFKFQTMYFDKIAYTTAFNIITNL